MSLWQSPEVFVWKTSWDLGRMWIKFWDIGWLNKSRN